VADEFLKKVGEGLRSPRSIDERLKEFVRDAEGFTGGGSVSILLFDRDTSEFYVRATTLRLPPSIDTLHYGAAGTVDELALRERRTLILTEVHRAAGARLKAEAFRFPLVSAGEGIGVLSVDAVTAAGIGPGKAEALEEAATLLADALGSSVREESAALRMTKIAAINEAGVNIISTLDLARLLKLVATSACLIMEAESSVVRLLDGSDGKYTIREFYGMKSDGEQKELFRMDTKAVTRILRGEGKVLVRDTEGEEEWRSFAGTARSMICLPLKSDEEIIGTLSVFDKFPNRTFYPTPFNADDVATLERFVKYAEKAVGNAIAFERNERLKNLDELTGLPTLRYFQERLIHEIARAKRFQRRLVLMICHVVVAIPEEGNPRILSSRTDSAMKRIAHVIRDTLREYDILSRISESKFAMILPEAEDGKISAIPRIQRAIAAEADEIRKKYKGLRVDVRFGHAAFPEDGDNHEKLVFRSNLLRI
jgi:diguanylate cyclase (GGDEF)-like protein